MLMYDGGSSMAQGTSTNVRLGKTPYDTSVSKSVSGLRKF